MSDLFNNSNTIAPISTVVACMSAMQAAMDREQHLPGIVALYGRSGLGKSKAAALTANSTQAYFVQLASAWTKKAFLSAILKEMGVKPELSISQQLDQVCEELSLSRRPLIIDEADYAVDKNMLDLIRDIYEGSDAAILLIGEEQLSNKILRKSERFHNRMLHWAKAEPATHDDASKLRDFYGQRAGIKVDDDLLKHINTHVSGCVRRLCVNLSAVHQEAKRQGITTMSLEDWGDRQLFSGKPRGAR
jgi:DNA transposition AAA+ family ATPase